ALDRALEDVVPLCLDLVHSRPLVSIRFRASVTGAATAASRDAREASKAHAAPRRRPHRRNGAHFGVTEPPHPARRMSSAISRAHPVSRAVTSRTVKSAIPHASASGTRLAEKAAGNAASAPRCNGAREIGPRTHSAAPEDAHDASARYAGPERGDPARPGCARERPGPPGNADRHRRVRP